MSRLKNHINVAVIGSLGSGKSTLCGHLLHQCGTFDNRTVQNSKDEVKSKNLSSMNKFSFMVCSIRSRRGEIGTTVDNEIHRLETPNTVCTLVDTPGHEGWRDTMIATVRQADVAMLVVDATVGDEMDEESASDYFEVSQIAYTNGIRQMIVVLTKLDDTNINFSESRFNMLAKNIRSSFEKTGFSSSETDYIPTSGLQGDNLSNRSSRTPWYDGPYLIQALDRIESPVRQAFKPLWIPVLSVCHVERVGTVAIGTIEEGTLVAGMEVKILPNGATAKVESIEMHHNSLPTAQAGDHVGFNLIVDDSIDVRSGCIVTDADVAFSTLVDHGYL